MEIKNVPFYLSGNMPCPHKFSADLDLQRIDFVPQTLVVGTFNPSWPEGNGAGWFYGRTRNNYFWDVLPRLHESGLNLRQGSPADWKNFCRVHRVALTDLVSVIADADETNPVHRRLLGKYLDSDIAGAFEAFEYTDVVGLLEQYPTIRNVYLTRQPGIAFFDARWALVVQFATAHPERELHVRQLLTPSGSARFQIADFKAANPGLHRPLRHFIHRAWSQQWHGL
ncbi:hypothetical protein ACFS5N_13445 [Mucilaginibacter ximonensis]|uniref:G/U mismatch-specific uracil-DNA glycosylase n=1 Tax=Mucilaginibacter ximonensis TaxID=538021 RepID=A0ABW5YEN8_9SPHI